MNPNEVVGSPRDIWVWLAPDWSDYQEGEAKPARGKDWTRVKIRETMYADGRIVRNVLNEKGVPVAADGTPAGGSTPARELDPTPQYDKNQQQRWKDQQAQAGRGDQEGDTRGPQNGPQREVYRGGKWVMEPNPLYQGQQGDAPPGGKPFIDDGPDAGASGRRWGWNPSTRAYDRDLGPSPSAQQPPKPTSETVRKPVQNRPGYVEVTTRDSATGKTETYYEDANGNRVNALPSEPPKETRQVVAGPDGKQYVRVTVQKPDGTSEVYHTDQNGNRVQMPDDPSKQPVKVPASLQGWRPDTSKPGHGLIERRAALFAAAERGEIRWEDVPSILQQDIGLAESMAQQEIRQQTEGRNLRNEQRADRNTALSVAANRQANVGNLMQESRAQAQPFVGKVAPPPGASIAGGAMRTQYELTRAMGGYDVPPDVEMPKFAQGAVQAGRAASTPTPPNALGVGSVGSLVAPTGARPSAVPAVTQGVTATNTAANNPTGANIDAANGAVQNGFNQAVGPLLKPPPPVEGAPEAGMPAWGRNAMASVSPAQRLRLLGYPDDVIQEALSRGGMVA